MGHPKGDILLTLYFFVIFKAFISFHMITQSVFYPNNSVRSKLNLHTSHTNNCLNPPVM